MYTTSHSNVEPALLMKENQQLTLRLVNNAFDTYVCSLSPKFVALGRVKLMQPVTFHAVPSSILAISSSTRISLLELIA